MGLIPFGKIVKRHGTRGEVKLKSFSRDFENLSRINRIFIRKKSAEPAYVLNITHRRLTHKGTAIVGIEGVESVEAAEELNGCLVWVDTADLSETEEDEYYWFELIGLDVYTTGGDYLGEVSNLMDRAAQGLLVVRNGDKEFFIPMVDAIVKEINIPESKLVVHPIPGLLD